MVALNFWKVNVFVINDWPLSSSYLLNFFVSLFSELGAVVRHGSSTWRTLLLLSDRRNVKYIWIAKVFSFLLFLACFIYFSLAWLSKFGSLKVLMFLRIFDLKYLIMQVHSFIWALFIIEWRRSIWERWH